MVLKKNIYSVILLVTLIIIIGFALGNSQKNLELGRDIISLSDGWEYFLGDLPKEENGNFIFTQSSQVQWNSYRIGQSISREDNTQILWVKIKLPDRIFSNLGIYFYNITDVYEAYIDNALIFRDYPVDALPTRLIKGLNRHEILVLEKSHHGKMLYLRIASGWKAIGIAGTPLLGNAKDLLFYNLQSYFHVGLLGILYISFGLLGYYFFYRRSDITIVYHFSMFSFLVGIVTIHHSPYKYYFYNNSMFWTYINIFAILGSIYFFICFFSEFYGSKYFYYEIGKIVMLLSLAANIIILLTKGISNYHFILIERPVVVFTATQMIFTVYQLIAAARKGNKQAKILLVGKAILLFSLLTFFLHTIGLLPHQEFYFPIGFSGLVFSIALVSAERYTAVYSLVDEYAKKLEIQNTELMEVNEQLKYLNEFKERIFFDIHDHIGGDISELMILQNQLKLFSVPENYIDNNIFILRKINQSVRDKMQVIRDFNNIQKDFLTGLQIYLLRRYGSVERKCRFEFQETLSDISNAFTNNKKQVLFSVGTEVANNDLKYGYTTSEWNFILENGVMIWTVSSPSNYKLENARGEGTDGIALRLGTISATCKYTIEEGIYRLTIRMPI